MRQAPCLCGQVVGWKMEAALPNPSFGSCRFGLGLSSSARGHAALSSIPLTLRRADALHPPLQLPVALHGAASGCFPFIPLQLR